MNADKTISAARITIVSLSLALVLAGCKGTTPAANDATLTTQVQARLFADQNLSGQTIQASVANGVVTLSGSVTSDTARTIASGDAAQVAGIKTVVNNIVVQPGASPAAVAMSASRCTAHAALPMPAPTPAQPVKPAKPSASTPRNFPQPAPIVRNTPAPQPMPQPAPIPAPVQQAQLPPPPPPPPPTARGAQHYPVPPARRFRSALPRRWIAPPRRPETSSLAQSPPISSSTAWSCCPRALRSPAMSMRRVQTPRPLQGQRLARHLAHLHQPQRRAHRGGHRCLYQAG